MPTSESVFPVAVKPAFHAGAPSAFASPYSCPPDNAPVMPSPIKGLPVAADRKTAGMFCPTDTPAPSRFSLNEPGGIPS
ncbi:MAG: hypothetical protein L6Q53_06075 [Candidatus Brocadia sinica]|nr:hypothetical protein [Candidatus Brocadia sinica]